MEKLDIMARAGSHRALVETFTNIEVEDVLVIEFIPAKPDPAENEAPLINFLEVVREDAENLATPGGSDGFPAPARAEEILQQADEHLDRGGREQALGLYHKIFESPLPKALRIRALQGMQRMAQPESLTRVKQCLEGSRTILSEYKPLEPELLHASVKVCLAVAERLEGEEKRKALGSITRMLPDIEDPALRGEVVARLGYILDWPLLGPLPWPAGLSSIAEVHDQAKSVDPGKPLQVKDRKYGGKDYAAVEPRINLQDPKALGAHDRVSALAYAEIVLEEAKPIVLQIGSDDGFKCWFNGKHVGGYASTRGFSLDATSLKVEGKAGRNTLLVQIIEQGGDWAFSVRVTD